MSKAELAASYAAIILADEDIQPTVSNQDPLHGALLSTNRANNAGRQTPDPHQGGKCRGCRAHMGNSFCKGAQSNGSCAM